MSDSSATHAVLVGRYRIPRAVLWGGLICGCLDLTAAMIDANLYFNMAPLTLLQVVARAILGPVALQGGIATAALGAVMHFSLAFMFAAIFCALGRRHPALLRWPLLAGPVYGALVFLFMYRVTVPLSLVARSFYLSNVTFAFPPLRWQQFVVHLVCVGCPIALAARRFAAKS